MKRLRFFKFVEGKLEEVESFSIVDQMNPYSYLIVLEIDGIPVRSMLI